MTLVVKVARPIEKKKERKKERKKRGFMVTKPCSCLVHRILTSFLMTSSSKDFSSARLALIRARRFFSMMGLDD